MLQERRWEENEPLQPVARSHWAIRGYRWLRDRYRPHLGWLVLVGTLAFTWLPALALGENRIEELRRIQAGLDLIGPTAVLTTWLLLGWRAPRPPAARSWLRGLGLALLFLLTGLIFLSHALTGWLPGPVELWQTAISGSWLALGQAVIADWQQLIVRFDLWWQGVQGGGAAQDNLIFAIIAGTLFWSISALTVWLLRRTERGLLSTLPLLWLLGTLVLYTSTERMLLLAGVALALLLHLLLDQRQLVQRWQQQGLDYSSDLAIDRVVAIGLIGFFLFLVAAILPNLYYRPLVVRYYEFIQPVDAGLEALRGRLFPELAGISRRGGAGAGGLPNAFLLGGNVDLGEKPVMQVRTNETAYYDAPSYGDFDEVIPPPGHYMRGATLTRYDGTGWDNPATLTLTEQNANRAWTTPPTTGRRELVQSVTLYINSPVLYAAPEPLEPGIEYAAQLRADGDLVALQQRARTYTIISTIPAVSTGMLADAPNWDAANPLPPDYAIHLELPDTITDRTRALAAELTAEQPTLYGKARAIEQFLRQYEYDLDVPRPTSNVPDVADYFLFDLQRGYCDYYATAFIVMARLVGLPARFATGYAVGRWLPAETAWLITESEAHSWPEVYFPDYGWIPFEPTAGRAELTRVGLPDLSTLPEQSALPLPPITTGSEGTKSWNWQMLFWLLPLGLLIWGVVRLAVRYQQAREEPWAALQRWGRRWGRPLQSGETVLEYGRGLADYILQRQSQTQDVGRHVAREVTALSHEINGVRYGSSAQRKQLTNASRERWIRLRGYLQRLSLRR